MGTLELAKSCDSLSQKEARRVCVYLFERMERKEAGKGHARMMQGAAVPPGVRERDPPSRPQLRRGAEEVARRWTRGEEAQGDSSRGGGGGGREE